MPPLAQLFAGKPEGAAESDHQRTYADRVQESVVVLVLDADQPHQCSTVAQHRARNGFDHRLRVIKGHGLAQAHVAHHGAHDLVSLIMNTLRPGQFLPHRDADDLLLGCRHGVDDFLLYCRLDLVCRHRLHVIKTAVRVDIDMLDARLDDAA